MTAAHLAVRAASVVLIFLLGCDRGKVPEGGSVAAPVQPAPVQTVRLSDVLARPASARVVAIGDFHGDLDHARRALRLAGAIDAQDAWIGGKLVVVQTGDEIDRGDDDRTILDLVDKLKIQAKTAGGELIALLGNHEIMNAQGDFRYVTPGGSAGFSLLGGREAAFAPGGPYAIMLSHRPIVVKVGDSLFVHGGILPKHLAYGLDKMNAEVDDWLLAKRPEPPAIVTADDGPVWTRAYSDDGSEPACTVLSQALAQASATRMVVGHTVQPRGVNSACNGTVWRIDVGLSHYYGGPTEALEIVGEKVSVLRESSK